MHSIELQQLLNRYRLSEESPADSQLLAELLADEANTALLESAIDQAPDTELPEGNFDATFNRIREYIHVHKNDPVSIDLYPQKQKRRWIPYAAAILITICAGTAWWLLNEERNVLTSKTPAIVQQDIPPGKTGAILTLGDGKQIVLDTASNGALVKGINKNNSGIRYDAQADIISYNTLSTPKGRTINLVLADGSNVWLNAGSSITYPTSFTKGTRSVKMTGEAYFEVVKNPSRPFIVEAGEEQIEVLGTSFNVNAYTNESAIKTTLLEGSIRIRDNLLKPGQQAQSMNNTTKVVNADVEEAVAWKEGYFRFNRADVPTVMRQLERWYDIEVRYEGKTPDRQFGGELKRDLPLSSVLRFLQKAKVNFRQEGKIITIIP